MRLTFIIPIYNALPYLRECVASCVSFPWHDKEIILVDDGSTDGSGIMCDTLRTELQSAVARFVVVHQPNGGVSAARNRALDLATGDWLWMVDADDRVLPEGFGWLLAADDTDDIAAQLRRVRRVVTGFVWDEGGEAQTFGATPNDVPYNLWRTWFRRDVVERLGLRFTLGRRYAEDQEFILRYTLALDEPLWEQTLALNIPAYHYAVRPGSAMTRPGMKWRQTHDIVAVWFRVLWQSLRRGKLLRPWVLRELRRIAKTALVTVTR